MEITSLQYMKSRNTIPLTVLKSNTLLSKMQKPAVKVSCKKMSSMQSCDIIEKQPDFYQLLSLKYYSGFDEVKKAYKKMALQYHPDVCSPTLTKDESMKRFIELREAYETLSDQYSVELNLGSKRRAGDERFPREVWERQLDGLKKRCHEKLDKRSGLFTNI